MPRRVLFFLGVSLVALTADLRAQETARVVIVSERVGEVIDRGERDAFKLFSTISSFHSAVFYLLPGGAFAGRVTRGIAGSTTDTLVWYSEPALEALGERIDHFEKFANFEYQIGSEPTVLMVGRTVPIAEVGTPEDLARRPVWAAPAPASVTQVVESVRIDSMSLSGGTVPDTMNHAPILLPPCAKQDAIIPRLCDTLDAYAWRYYGFVPALQGVTGASLARTADGAVLRVSTRHGDTSIFLSAKETRLLADFIGDYEMKMRSYDGDGTLSAESIMRLGLASNALPLFERGLLALRPSGDPASRVIVRTVWGEVFDCHLLYASEEAVYLGKSAEMWSTWGGSVEIQRIERRLLASIRIGGDTRFASGFLYGWLASAALLSHLFSESTDYFEWEGGSGAVLTVIASVMLGLPAGIIVGLLAQIGDPAESEDDIRMRDKHNMLPARLLSAHAFPSKPPPEVHALLSEKEKRQIDSLSGSLPALDTVPERITSSSSLQRPAPDPQQSRTSTRFLFAVNLGMNSYQRSGYDQTLIGMWSSGRAESNIAIAADFAIDLPVLAFSDRGAGLSLRPHAGGNPYTLFAGVEVVLHSNGPFYLASGIDYQKIDNGFLNLKGFYDVVEQSNFTDHLFLSVGAGFAWTSTFLEFQWRTALGTPLYSVGPKELWLDQPLSLPRVSRFTSVLVRYGWMW